MDLNEKMAQATEVVKRAIDADKKEDYEDAYRLYQQALQLFMFVVKYDKNPQKKQVIMQRVEGYLKRAEQLKEAMENRAKGPQRQAAGGGEGGDDGNKKLRSALENAVVSEKPNVKWSDVAGLEGAKAALKEAVILPARFPQLFTGKRRPWKGILLYGPPGTGKSYLAKAVATEADSVFYSVSSSDLVSKWQGESERLVKNLFQMARENTPAIIFIDEIDSLCGARGEGENDGARRIKTEFLVQMQGVGKTHDGILVLGATNTPWSLDPAMRRRFEKRIYIALPEDAARAYMFKIHVGDTPHELTESDFEELGRKSAGFSGSDISVVVREALMEPLRQCQSAKFFRKDNEGFWIPVTKYPSCPYCPMDLKLAGGAKPMSQCTTCGAYRMTMFDIEDGTKLRVQQVTMEHFRAALERSTSSVSPDELTRFEEWTHEFGQEG